MRFYNVDGSYEIKEDFDFGWWIFDDERDVDFYNGRKMLNGNILKREEIEDTFDLADLFECANDLKVEKFEPLVEVQPVVSVHQTQLKPEVYSKGPRQELGLKKVNMLSNYEDFREELSRLISPTALKSRILLSVVNFPKFKKLIANNHLNHADQDQYIADLEKPCLFSNYSGIGNNLNKLEKVVQCENNPFKRKPSLFEEMASGQENNNSLQVLTTRNQIFTPFFQNDQKSQEKLSCVQLDCLKLSATVATKERFHECTDLLYNNLKELTIRIEQMKNQLINIRLGFQEEDKRSARLVREFRKLSEELRERNYLNEVLFLLMGQAEKVKSNNWPFRVCCSRDKELNLII